jgi:hypothetical protein
VQICRSDDGVALGSVDVTGPEQLAKGLHAEMASPRWTRAREACRELLIGHVVGIAQHLSYLLVTRFIQYLSILFCDGFGQGPVGI